MTHSAPPRPGPRRRVVLLDVDGTMVDVQQRVDPSVVEAVRAARRNGHLVYIATGRSRAEIPTSVRDIGFDGVVSAGGGFIEHHDGVIARRTMSEADVRDLSAFFDAHRIEFTLQGFDAAYPSRGFAARVAPLLSGRPSARQGSAAQIEHVLAYRGLPPREPIAKATFFGESDATFRLVHEAFHDRFTVITGTIPYLGEAGGEVSAVGVDKGSAAVELAGHLEVPMADTIGIGDSVNDLEMLDVVGVGIAMGNATDEVKARADEVTTGIDAQGVSVALRRHGLID